MTPYQQLWSVVDGAVVDAFKNHPDYLTPKGRKSARTSVVKRVTGTVLGFAVNAAKGRPLQPAETHVAAATTAHAGEGEFNASSPPPHCRIGRVTIKRKCSSRFSHEFNVTLNALLRARNERGK